MGKINWSRVVMGGLLTGLLLIGFDFLVNGVWLKAEWEAAVRALGKPMPPDSTIAWFVLTDFLVGIFLLWLYAAIRPRYGAGPQTALRAGVAAWFVAVALHALGEAPLGLLPLRLYVVSGIVALIFVPLATVAGAWLYKEES